jgi:outer membrane protein W
MPARGRGGINQAFNYRGGVMKRIVLACGIVLALAAFQPASAADITHFKLFGAAAYVSPLSSSDVTISTITDSVQASNELGWEAGLEFRPIKWFGIEASYLNATNDIEFGGTKIARVDFTPYNLALNFHVLPSKYFDLYFGACAAYVNWGDIKFDDGTSESTDSEVAYGASVGLDISFHKNFAFIGGVRWLSLDLTPSDSSSSDSVAVDPLISRVGFAFRW